MEFLLECRSCHATREAGSIDYRCSVCAGELVVRYSEVGDPGPEPGVWRYRTRLPVADDVELIHLGEGGTPLVRLAPGIHRAAGVDWIGMKCEHLGPTGSFKDRIAAVAATLASSRNLRGMVGTSSGNGGAAAAAYARRAGLPLWLFALSTIPPEKLLQLRSDQNMH